MRRYDVVVIGAGPAGSVTARSASVRGLDVLLLDKATFPRFKVCGCCLNARALKTLERLGLGDLAHELGARPLTNLSVCTASGRAALDLTGSVAVSRRRLDAALVERAQREGVSFVDGVRATMGPVFGASRRVTLEPRAGDSSTVRAGVVVIADGLAGTALRGSPEFDARVRQGSRIGAGTVVEAPLDYAGGVVTLACGRHGYVGTVRLEDDRLDVAAALDRGYVIEAGGPGAAAERILDAAGLPPIKGLAASDWRGTPALTRRRSQVAGDRCFILGDAAGYVEPFTGEGIAWAVEGAASIGDLIEQGASAWCGGLARAWTRRHRSLVRRRQLGCRAVSALLRRPNLLHGAIKLIGRSPGVAAPLVRRLTQPPSG